MDFFFSLSFVAKVFFIFLKGSIGSRVFSISYDNSIVHFKGDEFDCRFAFFLLK